ncbi:hypothetical protein CPB97_006186, partial [Podila verticillata]
MPLIFNAFKMIWLPNATLLKIKLLKLPTFKLLSICRLNRSCSRIKIWMNNITMPHKPLSQLHKLPSQPRYLHLSTITITPPFLQ